MSFTYCPPGSLKFYLIVVTQQGSTMALIEPLRGFLFIILLDFFYLYFYFLYVFFIFIFYLLLFIYFIVCRMFCLTYIWHKDWKQWRNKAGNEYIQFISERMKRDIRQSQVSLDKVRCLINGIKMLLNNHIKTPGSTYMQIRNVKH